MCAARRLMIPEASLPSIDAALSKAKDARVAKWLLGLRLVCLRHSAAEVGRMLGVSDSEVRRWVNRFNKGGVDAMRPTWSPGPPTKLTDEQVEAFRERIKNGPMEADSFSSWRGRFVRDMLRDEFGVSYELTGVYKLLHRLGLSPRSKHPGSFVGERERVTKTHCRKPARKAAG